MYVFSSESRGGWKGGLQERLHAHAVPPEMKEGERGAFKHIVLASQSFSMFVFMLWEESMYELSIQAFVNNSEMTFWK